MEDQGPCAPLGVSLRQTFPRSQFFGGDDVWVSRVVTDSVACQPGDVLAILGDSIDPLQAACDALARGAAGILTEQLLPIPLPQCIVNDVGRAAAKLCDVLHESPTESLLMVGVVGADGKTSTALLTAAMLRGAGYRTAYETDLGDCDGVIQSVPPRRADTVTSVSEFLASARDSGSAAAVIELSAEMLHSPVVDALQFDVIVLTGGKPSRQCEMGLADAMDLALERLREGGVAIVNGDSPAAMAAADRAGVPTLVHALRRDADVSAKIFEQQPGMTTLMVTAGDVTAVLETPLTGAAMAANQLAAITLGLLLELPLHQAIESISGVKSLPGRMQRLPGYGETAVVLDAAGSAARLGNALRSLRRERCGGKLWIVATVAERQSECETAACGRTAERYADHVVLTSGAAGKANFLRRAHCWLDGVENVAGPRLMADRQAAIEWVLDHAAANDTVLIAGGWPSDSPELERGAIEADAHIVAAHRDRQDSGTEPVILSHPALHAAS
ncbi:glutamate ligase domain-containing protein [Candidatus Laterigemmans baculatus]|uniref:glutamate ligase domain-containing protein n=1 Tax=Candidatus Laterigemmans baculatus TaxID=2770505 RepID=UPI0013D93A52|nr:Mur ligase family protein [Candidatus Laterigemmans baculatus]